MPLQQHEIEPFGYAAHQVCYKLGEDPHEQRQDLMGYYYPRWMDYARRMAELALMLRMLRENGLDI